MDKFWNKEFKLHNSLKFFIFLRGIKLNITQVKDFRFEFTNFSTRLQNSTSHGGILQLHILKNDKDMTIGTDLREK